jgi:hypothetical protein
MMVPTIVPATIGTPDFRPPTAKSAAFFTCRAASTPTQEINAKTAKKAIRCPATKSLFHPSSSTDISYYDFVNNAKSGPTTGRKMFCGGELF